MSCQISVSWTVNTNWASLCACCRKCVFSVMITMVVCCLCSAYCNDVCGLVWVKTPAVKFIIFRTDARFVPETLTNGLPKRTAALGELNCAKTCYWHLTVLSSSVLYHVTWLTRSFSSGKRSLVSVCLSVCPASFRPTQKLTHQGQQRRGQRTLLADMNVEYTSLLCKT